MCLQKLQKHRQIFTQRRQEPVKFRSTDAKTSIHHRSVPPKTYTNSLCKYPQSKTSTQLKNIRNRNYLDRRKARPRYLRTCANTGRAGRPQELSRGARAVRTSAQACGRVGRIDNWGSSRTTMAQEVAGAGAPPSAASSSSVSSHGTNVACVARSRPLKRTHRFRHPNAAS